MRQLLPYPVVPQNLDDHSGLVNTLNAFWHESDNARKGGIHSRDDKWRENLNLYWNRWDFSRKADWQAKETMPEVPAFVDRFAAALKDALQASHFYTVTDPADREGDVTQSIKKMLDVWLTQTGLSPNGHPLAFPAVFEEQLKLGALMAMSSTVQWRKDQPGGAGRVSIEPVDPRFVWLDHTGRGLYRVRRYEIDLKDLQKMTGMKDAKGEPMYDLHGIEQLVTSFSPADQQVKEEVSGHGQMITSQRAPIVLDEYYTDVIGSDGRPMTEGKKLVVVANQRFLLRGPEANPFWHGRDWMVYTPLLITPLSVYGRTYMEDFGSLAKTFNELTNLIIDAVHTTSMNAFALVPSALSNPAQAMTGVHPNKTFLIEDGYTAQDVLRAIELGTLDPGAMTLWSAIKTELREAAGINEIGMGQFAPKGRTTAQEIATTQQNSSAIIRSIAQTVETRWLDPTLDLVWKTGLQHASPEDPVLKSAVGEEMWLALYARRKELVRRPLTFQARGISAMIQRQQQLQNIIQMLMLLGQNEILLQTFLGQVDPNRLLTRLMDLANIDMSQFQASDREKMIKSVMQPIQQAQERLQGTPLPEGSPGSAEMKQAAELLGIARGGQGGGQK